MQDADAFCYICVRSSYHFPIQLTIHQIGINTLSSERHDPSLSSLLLCQLLSCGPHAAPPSLPPPPYNPPTPPTKRPLVRADWFSTCETMVEVRSRS